MKPYIFVSTAHLSIIIRILTRSKVYDLFFVSLLPHILAPRGKQTLSFILYAKITFTFFPEKKNLLRCYYLCFYWGKNVRENGMYHCFNGESCSLINENY